MMHIVQKWQIKVYRIDGIMEFSIDDDFLGNVFEALKKINFGINVTEVSVKKLEMQQSTTEYFNNSSAFGR